METTVGDALALFRSLIERGHECATYDEDEMCFYCMAQKDYAAPRRPEDHNADCLYLAMLRFIEVAESEPAA